MPFNKNIPLKNTYPAMTGSVPIKIGVPLIVRKENSFSVRESALIRAKAEGG
ncbi:hypothetical protein [Paenibacillus kobensis]|uniref:hypothetical protein n=1 Tax=Paenibacillus kobensis TaxID=59841 RepID=UPI0013E40B76|nr:hypothetical protein [Paenibacillus kobensis]